MRTHSVFQTPVALIAVLVFSQPLGTLAQQEGALQIAAKTAAERDANRDINKLLWFGAGVCVPVSGSACLLTGGYIGFTIDGPRCGIGPYTLFGGLTGYVVGTLAPSIAIVRYQATPPPERLLGKSPAYVLIYTLTYEQKMRWLRIKWALPGAATGCAVISMWALISDL